jgi:hypothetical protein
MVADIPRSTNMQYSFVIDRQRNLVWESWRGRCSWQSIQQSLTELFEHPDYVQELDVISDFTDAELDFTYAEMRAHAAWASSSARHGRFAMIVRRAVDFGLARMFQTMVENQHGVQKMQVFYSLAAAEQWITSGTASGKFRADAICAGDCN